MRKIENFIAGEYVAAASGQRFDKRSPLDNRVIASIAEAGRGEVDAAVKAARGALQGEWGGLTTEQRVELRRGEGNPQGNDGGRGQLHGGQTGGTTTQALKRSVRLCRSAAVFLSAWPRSLASEAWSRLWSAAWAM